MILVFYAFARELGPTRRRLTARSDLGRSGLRGFRANVAGGDIAFIATGIGMQRSRAAAVRALSAFPRTAFVISSGVAGALSPGLRPGDIVIADRVLTPRKDSHYPEHVLPVGAAEVANCERVLYTAGLSSSTGGLLTSRRVLPDGSAKRLAKQQSGAIAVDMETAAIGIEAAARGIPFAAVRTILDAVDDEAVGAEIADEEGSLKPLAATAYILRNPRAVAGLARMMRNLRLATRTLADALDALLRAGAP